MRSRVTLAFVALTLIWGSTWLFIKAGLQDLPPLSFAGIRFVVAAAIVLAIVRIRRRPWPKAADLPILAATGLLTFTATYGLVFWGEQYISAGLAALLQSTMPAFGLLTAPLHIPTERITPARLGGTFLGIAGVGILFSSQLAVGGPMALWGSLAIVLAALTAAYANVLVKAKGAHIDPAVLTLFQMLFGLVPLLVVGALREGSPLRFAWTLRAAVCLLYLALVGSAFAFVLFYWMLRRIEVGIAQLIALVTPLVAVLLDYVVFGEALSWRTALGGAAILLGMGVVLRAR